MTQLATRTSATTDSGRTLRFGWFIPTYGDGAALVPGSAEDRIPPGMDLFLDVAETAEDAWFEYALVPVAVGCYEAWITCAMIAARTKKLKPLVAARPGYIVPTMMAKMVSTFDQLSNGRVNINLIAGGDTAELAADGLYYGHDERYEIIDEMVQIMKRTWTEDAPVTFNGDHFNVEDAVVRPSP
ncbi:MAG TPA: LLM class flavin-dependent oxidoreductase [Dehalococcoidia bacterium]|nr:LLM class flavin-dependent oxidoreductase [Dehalococcoidia bacterium]